MINFIRSSNDTESKSDVGGKKIVGDGKRNEPDWKKKGGDVKNYRKRWKKNCRERRGNKSCSSKREKMKS